jgi:hypothetical protein
MFAYSVNRCVSPEIWSLQVGPVSADLFRLISVDGSRPVAYSAKFIRQISDGSP